jgi:glycerol-3-phosphate acyltransferase PlsX
VFKSHGSAKAKTFKNAIRLAKQYYEGNVIENIANALAQ